MKGNPAYLKVDTTNVARRVFWGLMGPFSPCPPQELGTLPEFLPGEWELTPCSTALMLHSHSSSTSRPLRHSGSCGRCWASALSESSGVSVSVESSDFPEKFEFPGSDYKSDLDSISIYKSEMTGTNKWCECRGDTKCNKLKGPFGSPDSPETLFFF